MFMLDRLECRQFLSVSLVDGTLTVTGTDASEKIYVEFARDGRVRAAIDHTSLGLFKANQVQRVVIDGRGGYDRLIANSIGDRPSTLLGGAGNDYIEGGDAGDFLHGGPGSDTIFGNGKRDILVGGSGNDILNGGAARDTINGSTGNDFARTDGNDSIHMVETHQPESVIVTDPIEDYSGRYSVTLQQNDSFVTALLDFTFPSTGWNVNVSRVQQVGNRIRITIHLKGPQLVFPAITQERVAVPLGNLPDGNYVIMVENPAAQNPLAIQRLRVG